MANLSAFVFDSSFVPIRSSMDVIASDAGTLVTIASTQTIAMGAGEYGADLVVPTPPPVVVELLIDDPRSPPRYAPFYAENLNGDRKTIIQAVLFPLPAPKTSFTGSRITPRTTADLDPFLALQVWPANTKRGVRALVDALLRLRGRAGDAWARRRERWEKALGQFGIDTEDLGTASASAGGVAEPVGTY